jgi:hypothetical protein
MSKILKKAFKNEPPATLPQCLHINLEKGLQQWEALTAGLKYHSTAFPETKKLTKFIKYKFTCIPQKLNSPNKLDKVAYLKWDIMVTGIVDFCLIKDRLILSAKCDILPDDKN